MSKFIKLHYITDVRIEVNVNVDKIDYFHEEKHERPYKCAYTVTRIAVNGNVLDVTESAEEISAMLENIAN